MNVPANGATVGSSGDGTAFLSLRDATKTYYPRGVRRPIHALAPITLSFEEERPRVVAVVGQSGSGKSTLGSLILGMEPATAGEVCFEGVPIASLTGAAWNRYRRSIQAVFQDPYSSFNPFYRVRRTLERPLRRLGAAENRGEVRSSVEAACRTVGMDPTVVLDRYPHQLSGGQRQRLMVARALALSPKLLVADEPVSMVDASLRASILDSLETLHGVARASVLYITHDLATAARISNSILVLLRGRIVEAGDINDVLRNPTHPYTRLLLRSIPSTDMDTQWLQHDTRRPPEDLSSIERDPDPEPDQSRMLLVGSRHAVLWDGSSAGQLVELGSIL